MQEANKGLSQEEKQALRKAKKAEKAALAMKKLEAKSSASQIAAPVPVPAPVPTPAPTENKPSTPSKEGNLVYKFLIIILINRNSCNARSQ